MEDCFPLPTKQPTDRPTDRGTNHSFNDALVGDPPQNREFSFGGSFKIIPILSRDPCFFLENHQKPWEMVIGILKRTMVEKNGESTPRPIGKLRGFLFWKIGFLLQTKQRKKQASNQQAINRENQQANHRTNESTNPPTNQPINQPTNQPTNQPINPPTNQSTNQPTNQPTNQQKKAGCGLESNCCFLCSTNLVPYCGAINALLGLSPPDSVKVIQHRFTSGSFSSNPAVAFPLACEKFDMRSACIGCWGAWPCLFFPVAMLYAFSMISQIARSQIWIKCISF